MHELRFATGRDTLLKQGTSYASKISDFATSYAPKILGAIVFYLIGTFIIGRIAAITRRVLTARQYDPSLLTFLVSLIKIGLNILQLISFRHSGADNTAFAALIVGAGVAIGSALN